MSDGMQSGLPDNLKRQPRALFFEGMGSSTLDAFELKLFDWYVRETEPVLSQMLQMEQDYFQSQIENGDPDPNDSGFIAVEYYTKRIRYAHVIYLVSLLETAVERACSKLMQAVGSEVTPFGPTDLKGGQWEKRYKFLKRYGDIEVPKNLRSKVDFLCSVRNFLVHENGSTSDIPDSKKAEIRSHLGINIDGPEFVIEDTFIQHAFESVKAFLDDLEKRIAEVIERTINALKLGH